MTHIPTSFSPDSPAEASAPGLAPVTAKLKWFNAAKGFGFVVPDDNPVDVFLHITQLQKLGVHGLGEGAVVLCHIDYRDKGAAVRDLVRILDPGAAQGPVVAEDPAFSGCFQTRGMVKNYRASAGFGFITPDDGMKDIFVHKSCLMQCGITELYPGQQVRVTFKPAAKGREAVKVEVETTP